MCRGVLIAQGLTLVYPGILALAAIGIFVLPWGAALGSGVDGILLVYCLVAWLAPLTCIVAATRLPNSRWGAILVELLLAIFMLIGLLGMSFPPQIHVDNGTLDPSFTNATSASLIPFRLGFGIELAICLLVAATLWRSPSFEGAAA